MLRGLSVKKRRSFYEKQLGKKVKVLFEQNNKKDMLLVSVKTTLR